MRAALLPLDDRPYNLSFVLGLADLAGIELLVPPRDKIGWFFSAGSPTALAEWLLDLPKSVEAVIIAVDMLTCGGLLASRSEEIDTDIALERLATLTRLRRERPGLLVLAFDTIIRTSLSARDPESRRVHRLLHRWTSLQAHAKEAPDEAVLSELSTVRAAIPTATLQRYLKVRERKHAVNKVAVELVGTGAIDVLHLLMEDVGPGGDRYGVHKEEQRALRSLGRDLSVSNRIVIQNGTDEGASTLLAYLANRNRATELKLMPLYSSADGPQQVPTFEDRPFGENLKSFVHAVGCVLTGDPGSADAVLAIHMPYGAAPDLTAFAAAIADFAAAGKPVGLVDATTNCADEALMRVLSERMKLDDLAAYSAWNTACNSLGTALAQLVIYVGSHLPDSRDKNVRLILERLLDDYVYEAVVRPELNQHLEDRGLNPWDLGEQADDARRMMGAKMQEVAAKTLKPAVATAFSFRATLPWPRTFEPEIAVQLVPPEASA